MKKQLRNQPELKETAQHYSNEKRDRYPNGDIWCNKWSDRIDRYTCIARTALFARRCSGCPANL